MSNDRSLIHRLTQRKQWLLDDIRRLCGQIGQTRMALKAAGGNWNRLQEIEDALAQFEADRDRAQAELAGVADDLFCARVDRVTARHGWPLPAAASDTSGAEERERTLTSSAPAALELVRVVARTGRHAGLTGGVIR